VADKYDKRILQAKKLAEVKKKKPKAINKTTTKETKTEPEE
jgi:hypothetical protein